MIKRGKIDLVVKKVSFEETEDQDLDYWLGLGIKDRLNAMFEWNKQIWKTINGVEPKRMQKIGKKVSKINLDQDDF